MNTRLESPLLGGIETARSDRRQNRRADLMLPLVVFESAQDGADANDGESSRGWSQDVSRNGIRFRTYNRMRSHQLTVVCQGSASVLDDDLNRIELQVAWERQAANGLWEYGAIIKKPSSSTTRELTDAEFELLLSELRNCSGVVVKDLPESQYSDSTLMREQDLVVSLRVVANSFSTESLRQHLKRKKQGRLLAAIALVAAGGAAMVGLSMAIAAMVPSGTWITLTSTAAVLMISSQFRD